MISVNKIEILINLVKFMYNTHFSTKIRFDESFDNVIYKIYGGNDSFIAKSSLIKSMPDDWFIVGCHSLSLAYSHSEQQNNISKCVNGDLALRLKSSKHSDGREIFYINENYTELKSVSELDSTLFQLQTMYSDEISFSLIVEYMLNEIIKDDVYVILNITKIFKLSETELHDIFLVYKEMLKENS